MTQSTVFKTEKSEQNLWAECVIVADWQTYSGRRKC